MGILYKIYAVYIVANLHIFYHKYLAKYWHKNDEEHKLILYIKWNKKLGTPIVNKIGCTCNDIFWRKNG